MAYNLQSLLTILEQILQPDPQHWILDHKRPQIQSFFEKASSLKQILENPLPKNSTRAESLESRIRDAAHKAEDIIESHMAGQMLSEPGCKSFTFSPPDLQQVIEELDSARHDLTVITNESEMVNTSLPGGGSVTTDPSSKGIVVGLDEDIRHLKERLTGYPRKLEIIPIVGMGGIGKTTLARSLYNDQNIVSHFDVCAWITISQDYNVRAILLGLLGCTIGKHTEEYKELLQKGDCQLGVKLYQSLLDRRYLIVLDDMWSVNAWDSVNMHFPYNDNGSRVILTAREKDVANYVNSSSPQHQMRLLNQSKSWNLLQQKVFGKENCPVELEMIGQKIASSCRGLPLAIHVIGGLLSKTQRAAVSWEHIAYNIRATISEDDEQVLDVLSLSYKHLPSHLKPCFLYMGAFPEDYEIRASKLIRLWVAEGFLKSKGDKSPEEEAEDCLKALVDRNLIVVTQHKSNGKAKRYSIHDLLRELCIKKAAQEKFLYSKRQQVHNLQLDPSYCWRRVSVHPSSDFFFGEKLNPSSDVFVGEKFMLLTRSLLCIGDQSHEIPSPVFSELRLLRVLDVYDIEFHQFPTEILQLVNLRYLALWYESTLPSAISRLWNLETLQVRSSSVYIELPSEICEMPWLRHILYRNRYLCINFDNWKDIILEKLQKISSVNAFDSLQTNFLRCIPNIKNLGICSSESPSGFVDLHHLHKLETLRCLGEFSSPFLSMLRFPHSLRKLTLDACKIPWRSMTTVASLPNLEVLKIRYCEFEGKKGPLEEESENEEEWEVTEEESENEEEWEVTEEEFRSLRFLELGYLHLVYWRADETNFPRLRHLFVRGCFGLKEIPSGIGEIQTLEMIEVYRCSSSVEDSARQIQANQLELGNDDIQVRITPCG